MELRIELQAWYHTQNSCLKRRLKLTSCVWWMIFKHFFFRFELTIVTAAMVQKYQSPVRVYKHPFELIMAVSIKFCYHFLTWQFFVLLSTDWALFARCCETHKCEMVYQVREMCFDGFLFPLCIFYILCSLFPDILHTVHRQICFKLTAKVGLKRTSLLVIRSNRIWPGRKHEVRWLKDGCGCVFHSMEWKRIENTENVMKAR